jgi:hypothetical protein
MDRTAPASPSGGDGRSISAEQAKAPDRKPRATGQTLIQCPGQHLIRFLISS